ncbi:MAG: hypothetical protein ACYS8W_18010 [Planctomycetota bacterium]|jgi:hypothetical protein
MIRFSCTCGKPFEVKEELAGKKIRCRFCSEISIIPLPSDARVSGRLALPDWKILGDIPVADKVCLHCGAIVNVDAQMCPGCGEVFGWGNTEAVPEVTMEVTDDTADAEPENPELTQSGRFKNIEDIDDAPAQFEIVEIAARPEPVELELLRLPSAQEPVDVEPISKQQKTDDAGTVPPKKEKPGSGTQAAQKPPDLKEDTGTFKLEAIIEEEEQPKKTPSGRLRKSTGKRISSRRRKTPPGKSSRRKKKQ